MAMCLGVGHVAEGPEKAAGEQTEENGTEEPNCQRRHSTHLDLISPHSCRSRSVQFMRQKR